MKTDPTPWPEMTFAEQRALLLIAAYVQTRRMSGLECAASMQRMDEFIARAEGLVSADELAGMRDGRAFIEKVMAAMAMQERDAGAKGH